MRQLPPNPLGRTCKKCSADDWYKLKSGAHVCAPCKRSRSLGVDRRARQKRGQGIHGHCDVCHLETVLHRDHNHETGAIRGKLCRGCNLALGHAYESIPKLFALIDYLKKWSGV